MNLFSPYKFGDLNLKNRMVMAPMTRCRAVASNVPNPLAATYYGQGTPTGGYIDDPGLEK